MSTGAWLYPHDLADLPGLAALVRSAGLDEVCVATSYHSLLAACPANPTRRVVSFPRGGALYRPDHSVWRGAELRPTVSADVADSGDALDRGGRFAGDAGVALCAWLVCLHGDDPGWLPPHLSIETVTGDRVPGAPCLASSAVQDYALRLVTDAARRADRVQAESLHWLPAPHALHNKVDGAAPRLSRLALSLCFCGTCRNHAAAVGVDGDEVARGLLTAWRDAWDGLAPDDPSTVPGLTGYLRARQALVTDLVAAAADATAAAGSRLELVSFGDPLLTGLDPVDYADIEVDVRALAYGPAARVEEILAALPNGAARHVGLSLLPEHVPDEAAARAAVTAAARGGAASLRFYHLGLVGERRRTWLPALVDAWHMACGAAR